MATNKSIRGLSRAGFRVYASTPLKISSKGVSSVDIDNHKVQLLLAGEKDNFIRTTNAGTFTVTVATPGVFSKTAHGFVAGDIVIFSTTGALPTGLTAGTKYYVISAGLAANSFRVSATYGGSAVNTTGTQSGTHTVTPASANIIGLSRRGFRITNTAGTKVLVKVGSGVHQVNLTDYSTCKRLRREATKWVSSTSATALTIRGIQNEQNGFFVVDNSTTKITSNNTNVSNADTVVVGSKTYTFKTALTEAKATGTITTSGTGAANNDTVTVGATTYTFKTTLTGAANEVLRDGTEDHDLTNLKAAINGEAGIGTTYGTGTVANASVTCGAVASHAVTVTAKSVGTAGNSIVLTKTGAVLTVSGTGTLAGGVNSVANEVLVSGVNADGSLTNLSEAINAGSNGGTDYSSATTANADATASVVASHAITLTAVQGGSSTISVSTTAATLTASDSTLTDGISKIYRGVSVVIDATNPQNYQRLRRHFKSWIEG